MSAPEFMSLQMNEANATTGSICHLELEVSEELAHRAVEYADITTQTPSQHTAKGHFDSLIWWFCF